MPQMLGMAARIADGIMMSDMPVPLAVDAIRVLDAGLAKHARQRPKFEANMFAAWHVCPDRDVAMAEARRWLVLRGIFRPPVLATFLDPDGVAQVMNNPDSFWQAFRSGSEWVEGVDDAVVQALAENLTFLATTDHLDSVIDKLRAFSAAGLGAISLRLYANPADSIRLIGRQILPNLT